MAVTIRVSPSASVQELNLQTRPRLPLVRLRGRIQAADGAPPRLEDRPQVRIKDPGLYGQIEQTPIAVDAEGHFTIELCAGIAYSAFAFSGTMRSQLYSAPVEFTPSKDNDEVVLTIDKTPDEFRKLRQAP